MSEKIIVVSEQKPKKGCLASIFTGLFAVVNGLFELIPGFRKLPEASRKAISGLALVAVIALVVVCMPKSERPEPKALTPQEEVQAAIRGFKDGMDSMFGMELGMESEVGHLEAAATNGVVAVMPILADIYRNGKYGITKNNVKADKWEAKYKELTAPGAEGAVVISDEMEEELKQSIIEYEQKKKAKAEKKAAEEAEAAARKKALDDAGSALKALSGLGSALDGIGDSIKKSATEALDEAMKDLPNE